MRHVLLAPRLRLAPSLRFASRLPFASGLRVTPSHLLVALSISAAIGTGASTAATAQDYPWCANYTKGSTSCSFVTFEQCMADVSGIGGFCERNTSYHPAAAPARQKARASSGLN
jgi:Protein of unknown function (DUF3551)